MAINVNELNISNSGFGIFLGAGASFEAGYPLMTTLTTSVLQSLNSPQLDLISNLVELPKRHSGRFCYFTTW